MRSYVARCMLCCYVACHVVCCTPCACPKPGFRILMLWPPLSCIGHGRRAALWLSSFGAAVCCVLHGPCVLHVARCEQDSAAERNARVSWRNQSHVRRHRLEQDEARKPVACRDATSSMQHTTRSKRQYSITERLGVAHFHNSPILVCGAHAGALAQICVHIART